ncbi:uncharacterized protein BDV14DRAFT_204994 [Aspergillus stella-maris]|uniref:uncharacterized protein n=1 Tax=Aspergillus stella-maris TaxID=1810926 RepID=UPI003CCE04C7
MASPFQSTDWVFITTSPSRQKPTSAQRSQMRERVMREIGYARRRVPRSQQTSQECASGMPYLSLCRNLSSSLATQALLPSFIIDHLTLDAESRWLLQHMFSNATPNQSSIYRDRWYPICRRNPAAFAQMLASYATHVAYDQPESNLQQFILTSHTKALAGVLNCLRIPLIHDRQALHGTLSAVTALACYSHLMGDRLTWGLHITAISQLIKESGISPDELEGSVMNLVQWVELIGCYAFDVTPTFGFGSIGTESFQRFCSHIEPLPPCMTNVNLPASLTSVVQTLRSVNAQLRQQITPNESFWCNPVALDEVIHPLTYRVLSTSYNGDLSPLSPAVRSAALLYLAEFRRKSGVSPVVTDIHMQRLRESLNVIDRAAVSPEMTMWLITVGAVEVKTPSDQCYFHSQLVKAFEDAGIDSFALWKQQLNSIVWFDDLFDHILDRIWFACRV